MTSVRVRLDARALYGRLALLLFFVRQLLVWMWIRQLPVRHPATRVLILLFSRRGTQRSLVLAMLLAGALTLVAELVVLVLIRPLSALWHSPRVDESEIQFHLAPGEALRATSPARRSSGWSWPSGVLVLTDRRVAFFPRSWTAAPWSQPLPAIEDALLQPAPGAIGGLLRGWPDRLAIRDGSHAPEIFAVPDAEAVVRWFHPPRSVDHPTTAVFESW